MVTKGYGFTIDDIDWSNPASLEPYAKAYELKMQVQDGQLWRMGLYVQSAVGTVLEHCFAGKKAKSKYIEKPLLEESKTSKEDDIQRQREKFVAGLMAMEANFKAAKKREAEKENV